MGEGVHEKQIYRGNGLKKGAWTVCRFKGRLGKKEGVVFLKGGGGGLIPGIRGEILGGGVEGGGGGVFEGGGLIPQY